MSLGRKITFTVLMTLTISVLSTLSCAPPDAQSEEPLTTRPVVQGPPILKLPAIKSLAHRIVPAIRMRFPKAKRAEATITTAVTAETIQNRFDTAYPDPRIETVIEFAKAQIGDPYVWGGNGPNGWDCSGLMVGSFHSIGVSLPRTSRAQFTVGSPVAYGQWAPGDLLFFGSSASSIHHVVLYIGNGQIIHASTQGVPVKVDTVKGGGSDYFGARRVL